MVMAFLFLPMKNWPDCALAMIPGKLDLQTHQVVSEPLLRKMGVSFDPEPEIPWNKRQGNWQTCQTKCIDGRMNK